METGRVEKRTNACVEHSAKSWPQSVTERRMSWGLADFRGPVHKHRPDPLFTFTFLGTPSNSFASDCGANDGDSVEIVNGPCLVALLAFRCHEAADTHYTFDLENSKCPGNFILH